MFQGHFPQRPNCLLLKKTLASLLAQLLASKLRLPVLSRKPINPQVGKKLYSGACPLAQLPGCRPWAILSQPRSPVSKHIYLRQTSSSEELYPLRGISNQKVLVIPCGLGWRVHSSSPPDS